jgi:hypothetical protein
VRMCACVWQCGAVWCNVYVCVCVRARVYTAGSLQVDFLVPL